MECSVSDQIHDGSGVLRYLSAADVQRCLASLERRLELAEAALVSLARDEAHMPPKPVMEPSPEALSECVSNFERGLPFVMGLIVLNDPDTGRRVVRHELHRCCHCANA